MGGTVRSFFGGRSRKMKREQRAAQAAQLRLQRDAEEEAQRERAEIAASGRRLRGAGRRALTFAGQVAEHNAKMGG